MQHVVMASGPEVFASRSLRKYSFLGTSSHRVPFPYRVSPGVPLQPATLAATALVRFRPLRRFQKSGAHLPWDSHTQYVAPSGFRNLLTLSFSGHLPALFQPVTPLGFSLQSLSPAISPGTLSGPLAFLPLTS
jgi:hypothetical protein